MIEFVQASRWYGEVIGINDVTCSIGAGVTALLGQNGAGKSTMMRLIIGQLRPTTGDVTVMGEQPFANPNVMRQLGFCPDIDSFPEHLSGREFVYRLARLDGFSRKLGESRTDELLHLVGMADRADKPLKGYSKGMRQRIKLAQALLHDPSILMLDEPLNGLDPVGRKELIDLLATLANEGKAVLVSSHILFEVEQMTRSMLLLHRGRLLASGDLRTIRDLIDRYPHRIKISTWEPRRVAAKLVGLDFIISCQVSADSQEVEVETKEPAQFYDEIARLSVEEDLPILGFTSPDNNLEAVYQYLVEA
ncbi:MAG: ABC transporter ATP-binding protein [Fimbriimonadaceae bacterium]|nr:ABC transporter ATP-binding protein [Fimbriimonadaceae bacterium]